MKYFKRNLHYIQLKPKYNLNHADFYSLNKKKQPSSNWHGQRVYVVFSTLQIQIFTLLIDPINLN